LLRCCAIEIHERALFDFLTLELIPASPGDNLIAVEIVRMSEGNAVVTQRLRL